MAATSPSFRRPTSTSSANNSLSPNPSSPSNTHPVPSASSTIPTSQHSYFPPPPPSSIKHRQSSSARNSQPVSRSSSTTSISSLNTQSSSSQRATSPQSHRTKFSGVNTSCPKPNQLIMLHERPHSPSTLTSSPAPPSLIPMTAAGISVKSSSSKGSRKSPAGMKLSMLPSTMSPIVPTGSSGPAAPPVYTFSTHHQAYAHSLSAQQQLQLHQKEIIHQATRATGIPQHLLSTGPMSPRLIPLGSPGPVTPLTLEDGPDGFFGSSHGFGHQQLSQQLSIVASGQRGGL